METTRYRSHSCGQLRKADVGQTVKLAGWVHSYRDHGGLVFIDLRDREGLTQLVFNADTCGAAALEESRKLRSEWVVSVAGKVEAREPKLVNPKLATGEIELHVTEMTVLSISPTPPFTPDEHETVNEEKRLTHRYLDLRRPEMQATLKTRYRVTKIMRDFLGDQGFWEIETPFLTKSTPEGSRDFLVPSRLVPGSFYALPQSPQLFKQILMVAGCDKYMQIVRCFRDEDPRADRQAEFTQLDMEMSFVDVENVTSVIEGLLRKIWKEILDVEIPPIAHMTYDDAMTNYGSDRPDLRFGMKLFDLTDLAQQTDFGVFKSAAMVKCIIVPGGAKLSRKETDALAEWSKGFGAKGLAVTKVIKATAEAPHVHAGLQLDTGVAKFLAPIAAQLIERTGAKEGDLIAFAADRAKIVYKVLGELRLKMAKDLKLEPGTQYAWVWITDFPLLDFSEEDKKWVATHHPFTSPLDSDIQMLESRDPAVLSSLKSKAYDIVLNGSELGGGSIRIHRMDVQQKIFSILGIDETSQRQKFGFLLDALQYGAPPHGGIALGVDRVVMILRNTTNIRDVIAFPKTQSGADLMCGAPSTIEEKQLREANIRLALIPPKNPDSK
jgi:aspartyl-tRNA synthetase